MAKNKCVLVVDDEPGILRVLGIQLRLHGYDAVTTLSGIEAVELVRTRGPDVVLLDILLPDLNGFKVRKGERLLASTGNCLFCQSKRSRNRANGRS